MSKRKYKHHVRHVCHSPACDDNVTCNEDKFGRFFLNIERYEAPTIVDAEVGDDGVSSTVSPLSEECYKTTTIQVHYCPYCGQKCKKKIGE